MLLLQQCIDQSSNGLLVTYNTATCFYFQFSVLLLIIFVAELAVGIAGYVKRGDLEVSIERHLNESMHKYGTDKDITKTFDILQTDVSVASLSCVPEHPKPS